VFTTDSILKFIYFFIVIYSEPSELSQKIRRYDEKFFETNALIINSSLQYNSAREPEVEKVIIKGNELIVQISLKRGVYEDIAESWIFIIEINKASIEGVTSVTIKNTTRSKYK
jgi:hypothetical protein